MIDSTLKEANILIVDDQEANIDVLDGFLEMQGYVNIKSTTDPRNVVPLLTSFAPDLILLDLSMPYLSGFEVMEQLNAELPANSFLPVIVLTADITKESKQRSLAGGANDFLIKPFDLIEVGLRIRNLLYTSYLHQQLQLQNLILEEKVKERTRELEQQNVELIIAKEKAEASDKLKSTFISNISHEIRTPLNGIMGFGQILTDNDLSPEEKEQYSQMLNSSSLRLVNTITNFMDISLLRSGNQKVYRKELNVKRRVTEVVSKFSDSCLEKKLTICIAPPNSEDDIKLFTDGELFSKILYQLIDNAVKFTHQGTITVGYQFSGNEVHFFVSDTGIGISPENQVLIFDSFIQEDGQTTRRYEGSGLGLSIAQELVNLLEGKIWLKSEKGKGSTFYFSLPYRQSESEGKQAVTVPQPLKEKQTILIAEDDEINFYYFKTLLTHNRVEILHAEDGIEAVELCKENPEIELVLMDLKMVDMDGYEATRQIKSFRPELPVIAITAYSETEDKRKALLAGCDEFLTKPVKKEILIKKLEEFGLSYHKPL